MGVFIFFGFSLISGVYAVELDNALLKVSLQEGENIDRVFIITADVAGDYSLESIGLPRVRLSEESFYLGLRESREVAVSFDAENVNPGVYGGYVRITSSEGVSDLPVLYEVESSDLFFDSVVTLPSSYLQVNSGEEVLFGVDIVDLRGLGVETDVELSYEIKGLDGSFVSSGSQIIKVLGRESLLKRVEIPSGVETGNYFLITKIGQGDSLGISSRAFYINGVSERVNDYNIFFGIFILAAFILGAILFLVFKFNNKN